MSDLFVLDDGLNGFCGLLFGRFGDSATLISVLSGLGKFPL